MIGESATRILLAIVSLAGVLLISIIFNEARRH